MSCSKAGQMEQTTENTIAGVNFIVLGQSKYFLVTSGRVKTTAKCSTVQLQIVFSQEPIENIMLRKQEGW